jgi:hypothetical protein
MALLDLLLVVSLFDNSNDDDDMMNIGLSIFWRAPTRAASASAGLLVEADTLPTTVHKRYARVWGIASFLPKSLNFDTHLAYTRQ